TFPEAAPYFKGRAKKVVTGLPVRPELLRVDREKCRQNLGLLPGQLLLLSFGGSQGARSINRAMLEMCRQLAGRSDICLLHVTGPAQYEWFRQELQAAGINEDKFANINIKPYLHNMPAVLGAADLVICRAGAATIAEITVLGLPSILIPYPHAAGNHQVHNARALVRAGAAIMISDAELTGQLLQQKAGELLENRPLMASMARSAAGLGRPRALEEILSAVAELVQRGGL
ncbi:MAG: UDP-N-acetylglucosamine--N-acetylmuramyl-(pentapeptide) pyrophosphoryl-undecaprenol N-acetylglucosamine transferase, partial [Bacillota bacterium]